MALRRRLSEDSLGFSPLRSFSEADAAPRSNRSLSERVLVAVTAEHQDTCETCAGEPGLDYICRSCGRAGHIHTDGVCARCVISQRAHELFAGSDSTLPPQLQPLIGSLTSAPRPLSVLHWLSDRPSAALLAQLATGEAQITHELVDGLPQDTVTRYLRDVLVATAILPHRQETLARLQLWVRDTVDALPPHQVRVIRPFAEWCVVRDARRRATRGRYTAEAAAADRRDITVATDFMSWLDRHNLKLSATTQEDMDLWLTSHPTRSRALATFIRWTTARSLTSKLVLPSRRVALPSNFLPDEEYQAQLLRCLNDDSLPLEVRITGALVRLYALPLTRILELTTDRFHRDETGAAYLTLERNPVLLPPKLALLIEEQNRRPAGDSMFRQPLDGTPRFLLPGRPASRPLSSSRLQSLMNQNGLPTLGARNTAMIEAVSALPPIVVSDLFGVTPSSAYRWTQYAQDSWADYLAACETTPQ